MSKLCFSTIDITRQVFYRANLSYAIVNLKPIVPGHVLVVPNRAVLRLSELMIPELTCLMTSIQKVGSVIEKVIAGDGLTVACQDGRAAGQTIPHVHFHVLPRKLVGDKFQNNRDAVYPALEQQESKLPSDLRYVSGRPTVGEPPKVDADDDRPPRTMEEMIKEAEWLKTFFSEEEEESDVMNAQNSA